MGQLESLVEYSSKVGQDSRQRINSRAKKLTNKSTTRGTINYKTTGAHIVLEDIRVRLGRTGRPC